MEEKTWSKEQLSAINSVDANTLVSASAGSGKTELMMEKVGRMVVGEIEGHKGKENNIKNMMIVTFTKAVARELKVKVVNKLTETLQKPKVDRKRIIEQIEDVAIANISTIDSLCTNIVRTYFDEAGVDPTFTIMDEDESKLYLNRAIKKVIEQKNLEMKQEYVDLKALLSDGSLLDAITSTYNFARNKIDYINYLKNEANVMYESDNFVNSKLYKECCKKYNYKSQVIVERLKEFKKEVEISFVDGSCKTAVLNKINYEIDWHDRMAKAKDLFDLQYLLTIYPKENKVPTLAKLGDDNAHVAQTYDTIKTYLDLKGPSKYLNNNPLKSLDVQYSLDGIKDDKELLNEFISILLDVDAYYTNQKLEDNRLDFNDVEQKTIKVLENEEIKKDLQDKFDYICVDEYQDINTLQDEILARLSKGTNLFMVGDIKQSIYGFRLSEPTIFLEKYERYNASNDGNKVDLNINYRSKEEILDFVNEVFDKNMTKQFGHVDYENTAKLKPFDNNKSKGVERVKIKIFQKESDDTENTSMPQDNIYSVKEHINPDLDNGIDQEADYIIKTIKKLVNSGKTIPDKGKARQIKYDDIAILFRSRSPHAQKIVNEIQKAGIPIDASNAYKTTKNVTISMIISLLNIIDNEKQDVELVHVLLSVFGLFTMADLAKIRKLSPKAQFFHEAFNQYENNDEVNAKIKAFKQMLADYRFKARYMSVDELVKDIIDKYNYENYVLAQENGEQSLIQLNTFINSLENRSYNSSIARFLSVYREYSSIDETKESSTTSDNCVKTATVHASKGLQYPIVFLIDTGTGFKGDSNSVVCHKDYGLGIKHYDKENLKRDESYVHRAIKDMKDLESLEEGMRGLYVALTRPKEYLYITGTVSKPDEYKEPHEASCYFDWINYARATHVGFKERYYDFEKDADLLKADDSYYPVKIEELKEDPNFDDSFLAPIMSQYKYEESTKTPIWYSVTQINKSNSSTLEEEFDDGILDFEKFFAFEDDKADIKKTSKESGTAYHKVLEEIDYKHVFTIDDVKEAILDMYKKDILSQEQYDSINPSLIYDFLNNDFIKPLKEYSWNREESFKLYVKANEVFDTSVEDKILIQGTYDLFIPQKNMLIDYKFSKDIPENIRNTYKKQLNLYKKAIEACTPYKVDEMYIYVIGQNYKIKI